jgi:hypothetical protein
MDNPNNEIQKMLSNEFPPYSPILWTIFIGLLTAIGYRLVKRLLIPVLAQKIKSQQLRLKLDIIETLFLPIFGLAILVSILISSPLIGIVVSTILLLIFYKPMRNYMLGIIYRAGNTYSIGQRVIVHSQQGSIVFFNTLSLEMALENGSMVDIPYDVFSDAIIVRSSAKSGVLSHTMELTIPKPCDIAQIKQSIRTYLLSMPYVLPNQKISIEHLSDEEHNYLIKIIIYGIEKQQMYEVEGKLKALFSKEK